MQRKSKYLGENPQKKKIRHIKHKNIKIRIISHFWPEIMVTGTEYNSPHLNFHRTLHLGSMQLMDKSSQQMDAVIIPCEYTNYSLTFEGICANTISPKT